MRTSKETTVVVTPEQGDRVVQKSFAGRRFGPVDLSGTTFSQCDFRGAEFVGTDLTNCTFTQCDMNGIKFSEAVDDSSRYGM